MIGIDCGGLKIAIVDLDRRFAHALELKPSGHRGSDLARLRELLAQYDLGDGPKWVEAPVLAGARNIQSTIKVAQVTGLVHACLSNTHSVAVSSWKQRVVGSGRADKRAVRDWLGAEHPDIRQLCGSNQDLIDAACVALYGRDVQEALATSGLGAL